MDKRDLVGTTIAGRFEVVRLIGQGGMGTVYEAKHRTLPRKFAIKVLRRDLTSDPSFVERFRREAIASARIQHPNIIYITDFGHEDDLIFLVMEYLEGRGLDEVLSQNVRLPLNRAIPLLTQLADALDHAHAMDVVHRDLKPENILLTEVRGKKDVVKILDFGIAKMRSSEFAGHVLTMQGQVFGTAEYMSPEQATGEPLDGRADIYALGCLGYEMITGNPPFLGPPMKVLQAHVNDPVSPPSTRIKDHPIPPVIDALVLRCLAKDPSDRYRTAGELRNDLLKARSALFGLGQELVARRRATGGPPALSREALTSGWQSLGGQAPELFSEASLPIGAGASGPSLGGASMTGAAAAVKPDQGAEALRQSYHEAVREVALVLMQAAIASPETSEALERLLVVEEEDASLTGTIALSEQIFDRIRFEFSEREKRLRTARQDLSMTRAQLRGRAEAEPHQREQLEARLADLDFQINELTSRCEETEQECAVQIQELDAEVKRYREARQELDAEATELYSSLHQRIEALRPLATDLTLRVAYESLDRHVAQIRS